MSCDVESAKKRSFAGNYIFNLIYQVIALALPLVTTPYLSRVLGADGIGKYSFAQSIVSYFALFAALGTTLYGQRQIARVNADPEERSRLFWEIFIFRVLGACIAAGIYCVTIIPVSKITLGFAGGGLDIENKKIISNIGFGGGSGTGMAITPVAFLTVGKSGDINLMEIGN